MEHPGFFERAGPFSLAAVAAAADAKLADGADLDLAIKDVRPLDERGRGRPLLSRQSEISRRSSPPRRASACLVAPKFADQAPPGTACLVTPEPYRAFARALLLFYPDALKPKAARQAARLARSIPTAGSSQAPSWSRAR